MRILFMGTPEFAAASLKALAEAGHGICGVFTQPDRPKNRGHKVLYSPVKDLAVSLGMDVYQPGSLRNPETAEQIRLLSPELIVVAAYGKILPESILSLPPLGCINVHSSLLPKYRGAAPIHWAILNGETETGVSIMYMAKELDAGDVILQRRTAIGEQEDAGALTVRLAALGAEALLDAVAAIADGTAQRTPQDESAKTYAPLLTRGLSPVDWSRPARAIQCQIRGLAPWPGTVTEVIGGDPVKLWASEIVDRAEGSACQAAPGTVVTADPQGIGIVCGDGKILRILELQAQGGRRMTADAYLRGHPILIP